MKSQEKQGKARKSKAKQGKARKNKEKTRKKTKKKQGLETVGGCTLLNFVSKLAQNEIFLQPEKFVIN